MTHCDILTHDASLCSALGHGKIGKVVIGNNVFVGLRSVILCNVRIGNNVIIGAGSVVTHDIPDNSVAVGNPAQVIMSYDSFVEKHRAAMQTHPVYETYWKQKTPEEKARQKEELDHTYGYDV